MGINSETTEKAPVQSELSLSAEPFEVAGGSLFSFATGAFNSGLFYSCGENGNGELGNGTTTGSEIPGSVITLP